MKTSADATYRPPPRIMIVDDEEVARLGMKIVCEKAGFETIIAEDGREALEKLQSDNVDVVLTDIEMPRMNGLELLDAAKAHGIQAPFILITGKASVEYCVEALRRGALNFIEKPYAAEALLESIYKALDLVIDARRRREALTVLRESKSFSVPSRLENVNVVVYYLAQNLPATVATDHRTEHKMQLALHEAVINAHEHGNMEITSAQRHGGNYGEIMLERESKPPYCDRQIHASCTVGPEAVEYTIRDDGKGFDHAALPDPFDPENLLKMHGRGVLLMRAGMDEVVYNKSGSEVVMRKRAPAAKA